jgi:hypothetical protein
MASVNKKGTETHRFISMSVYQTRRRAFRRVLTSRGLCSMVYRGTGVGSKRRRVEESEDDPFASKSAPSPILILKEQLLVRKEDAFYSIQTCEVKDDKNDPWQKLFAKIRKNVERNDPSQVSITHTDLSNLRQCTTHKWTEEARALFMVSNTCTPELHDAYFVKTVHDDIRLGVTLQTEAETFPSNLTKALEIFCNPKVRRSFLRVLRLLSENGMAHLDLNFDNLVLTTHPTQPVMVIDLAAVYRVPSHVHLRSDATESDAKAWAQEWRYTLMIMHLLRSWKVLSGDALFDNTVRPAFEKELKAARSRTDALVKVLVRPGTSLKKIYDIEIW